MSNTTMEPTIGARSSHYFLERGARAVCGSLPSRSMKGDVKRNTSPPTGREEEGTPVAARPFCVGTVVDPAS